MTNTSGIYFFWLIILLALSATFRKSDAIIAYDCSDPDGNLTAISLSTLGDCKIAQHNKTLLSEDVTIQLFQLQDIANIQIHSSFIEISHILTRCGKSIDTRYRKGFYSEFLEVSQLHCNDLHQGGQIDLTPYGYLVKFEQLTKNIVNYRNAITLGSIDSQGSCNPGILVNIKGLEYDRPLRESKFKIIFRTTEASLDTESKRIRLVDGVFCNFYDTQCFSPALGMSYWSTILENEICKKQKPVVRLYQGKATKFVETIGPKSTVTYTFNSKDTSFAMSQQNQKVYCSYINIIQTEHPLLFIVEGSNPTILDTIKTTVTNADVDIITQFNSKLMYIII